MSYSNYILATGIVDAIKFGHQERRFMQVLEDNQIWTYTREHNAPSIGLPESCKLLIHSTEDGNIFKVSNLNNGDTYPPMHVDKIIEFCKLDNDSVCSGLGSCTNLMEFIRNITDNFSIPEDVMSGTVTGRFDLAEGVGKSNIPQNDIENLKPLNKREQSFRDGHRFTVERDIKIPYAVVSGKLLLMEFREGIRYYLNDFKVDENRDVSCSVFKGNTDDTLYLQAPFDRFTKLKGFKFVDGKIEEIKIGGVYVANSSNMFNIRILNTASNERHLVQVFDDCGVDDGSPMRVKNKFILENYNLCSGIITDGRSKPQKRPTMAA